MTGNRVFWGVILDFSTFPWPKRSPVQMKPVTYIFVGPQARRPKRLEQVGPTKQLQQWRLLLSTRNSGRGIVHFIWRLKKSLLIKNHNYWYELAMLNGGCHHAKIWKMSLWQRPRKLQHEGFRWRWLHKPVRTQCNNNNNEYSLEWALSAIGQ